MPLEQSIILEPYLNDITGSTESSKLKLIAAWDGLSVETQIKIIHAIGNRLPYEIIAKSLDSPNSYIRYLIAKEHYWDSSYEVSSNEDGTIMSQEENEDYNKNKKIVEKILNDKDPLVKSAIVTHVGAFEENPEKFFVMSKEEQILYFSTLSVSQGEEISLIIEYGQKHNLFKKDKKNDDYSEDDDCGIYTDYDEHLVNLIDECGKNIKEDWGNVDWHEFPLS